MRQKIKTVVGDRAYDSRELYDAAEDRGAKVVVPPIKGARVNRNGSRNRNKTVKRIRKVGRRRWKLVIIGKARWRTPSSGTRRSSADDFDHGLAAPRRPKRCSHAKS